MARHEIVASFWEEPVGPPTGYVRHRRGAVVDVPDEHVARLLRIGAIVPIEEAATGDDGTDDDGTAPTGDDAPGVADDGAPADPVQEDPTSTLEADTSVAQPDQQVTVADLERPKQAASKAIWVEYAVARGMDRDAAEELDKRELIAELD
ncbi:hypothetical protein ACFYVR_15980 [Rhodococcus sp. NPDC003318]|uniref:hypothetical protein n=1 Tax=Rhodococcus sp. NPDC003318 TaxID=3364503 RepID=UPI00369579BC